MKKKRSNQNSENRKKARRRSNPGGKSRRTSPLQIPLFRAVEDAIVLTAGTPPDAGMMTVSLDGNRVAGIRRALQTLLAAIDEGRMQWGKAS